MKTTSRIILSIMAMIAIAPVALIVAQSTNKEPSGEFWVNVNSSTNLNVSRLRITGQKIKLDGVATNWTLTLHIEAWNGETPPEITRSGDVMLNLTQIKALFNSADPAVTLESQALNKFRLTKKP